MIAIDMCAGPFNIKSTPREFHVMKIKCTGSTHDRGENLSMQ